MCAQSRMGKGLTFTNFKDSTASHLPIFFHPSFPKPSEVLKHGSAAPSSGQERGGAMQTWQALMLESEIWGMAQPSCSLWGMLDPFWTKRSMHLIQELLLWCVARASITGAGRVERLTLQERSSISTFWSVGKSVINQQRAIDFPVPSQPESRVSALTINNQCTGKLTTSNYVPGFSKQIIRSGRPWALRGMARWDQGILNNEWNSFAFCSSKWG